MDWYRIKYTMSMGLQRTGQKRVKYLKKHSIYHVDNHCMGMFRKIPLYPKLISMGDNVWIATGVTFIPHDAIHHMLNNCIPDMKIEIINGDLSVNSVEGFWKIHKQNNNYQEN